MIDDVASSFSYFTGDINNELVRHFLIESSSKGVKLKGCPNEPYFGKQKPHVHNLWEVKERFLCPSLFSVSDMAFSISLAHNSTINSFVWRNDPNYIASLFDVSADRFRLLVSLKHN